MTRYTFITTAHCLLILTLALTAALVDEPPLPLCRNDDHVVGEWIEYTNTSAPRKSFHCCQYDENDYLHNTTACFNPSWNAALAFRDTVLVTGFDSYPTYVGEHGCNCDKFEGRDSLNAREKYFWKPKSCSLVQWNASRFCELLGPRRILFVGDSTQAQTFATLTNLIHAADLGNASCNHQITFGRCNVLIYGLKGGKNLQEWVKIAGKPEILIVTAGAHLHDLGDMYSVQDHIKTHFSQIREAYGTQNISILWKTQNPGHVGCTVEKQPQKVVPNNTYGPDKWDWLLHPTFDAIARNYSFIHGYKVLDMSPVYLRPDSHSGIYWHDDCLHYCIPGALDIFAQLLLQKLVVREI